MARPFSHPISILTEDDPKAARRLVKKALDRAGSVRGAAQALKLSERHMHNICRKLGLWSPYEGHAGAEARWS